MGGRELRRLHARLLAGIRVELVVNAAQDAAPGLLLREVPEARVAARLSGKSHRSRIGDGERNVVTAECDLQRARRRSRQARRIPGI